MYLKKIPTKTGRVSLSAVQGYFFSRSTRGTKSSSELRGESYWLKHSELYAIDRL